ncbi:TonB-dependent receptor [candidate division KSB1 bacterium]|nr:TonB-dependent receptor [candidate division KSB1 bacterium]
MRRINYLWIKSLILGFLIFQSSIVSAGEIRGRIVDIETGSPLPGVNVQLMGTVRGSSTDGDGVFVIPNIPPGNYSLRASMISYKTQVQDSVIVRLEQDAEVEFKLKETPIEFDPIVVLGGRNKQRMDRVPVSLSVVTSSEIRTRNPTNIMEALESAPGIHFIGEQINIRGSTGYTFGAGNKVLLLLDGVPVYTSDTGQFNWDMLPPLDIEQIEVLKGAGSTLWGASALGGVVNVITKNPSPDGKLLFAFTAGKYDKPYYDIWEWTNNGRLHYQRQDISYSRRIGRLGMRISAGRYSSTGYTQLGDFFKQNLTGKFDYLFPNSMKWTVYGAFSNIDRGFFVQWKGQNDPYEVDESNLSNYADTKQLNLYTKLGIPLSPKFGINIRASMVRSLMGTGFGESASFNPAIGQGAEIQADWIPSPLHSITGGINYQHDTGSTDLTGDHKGYFIGPYLQDEWTILHNLRMTTGFRYDRYQLVGGLKEDLFSPRVGLNWQPYKRTSIRASAGSGFRAATIVERFLELTVMNFKIKKNEDLRAERSWAFDLGFRQYFTEEWNIDVSLFDNEYWDLIEAHLDLIRGQIQFRNVSRSRIQGIEATSKWATSFHWLKKKWTPGIEISFTGMNHRNINWDEPLAYRPKYLGNIKAYFTVADFRTEVQYRYASKIEEVKIYPINDRVPMKFLDIRLSYDFWKLKLLTGVNNLLQYNYAPMESNLMPMRTFTFGLQGEF